MFRKQKAGFKWGLLEQLITQKDPRCSLPQGRATLWLSLTEEHINGVMSWWLISPLLSWDSRGRKFKPVTHKLTLNQLGMMDRNHRKHG